MSFELFLDFLLSFVVLYVYHSDCHSDRTPAYACASIESPLFAPVHREFAPTRYVSPEDYESTSYLVQPDDAWVADPMDTDEPDLAQLFAMADAIEPMEADVAAELAALDAEVDALVTADPVRAAEWGHIKGQYDRKPKLADLRLIAEGLGISSTKLKVAELTGKIVQTLAIEGLTVFTMPNLANEILEVRDGKLVIVSDSFFD